MIAQSEKLEFGALDPARPDLLFLLERLRLSTRAFRHMAFNPPQKWYGVWRGTALLAAYGWNQYLDGTVEVQYALCRPCKEGRKLLGALAGLLGQAWENYRVVFHTEVQNRRMRAIVESIGCKPIALMYERKPVGRTTEGQYER